MKKLRMVLLTAMVASCSTLFAGILSFSTYHTPAQTDGALTSLANTYPALTRISTIGSSVEGRPIKVLEICSNPAVDDPGKGDVVFVALHHAREWISVEMALYLADELLARYSTDAELQADMNSLRIWIIPVLNPDGYEYTVNNYRYWRKNRENNGDGTFGVDLNRNYGFEWGLLSGSSDVTVDDTYHGISPFSEPEVMALRDFLQGRSNLKAFVTYHSFSELFLRPWSYTTADPPGEQTMNSIVERNIARIAAVHGHTYAEEIWYTSSGDATDYVWNELRLAPFTTELRPSSGGLSGFSPPPSEILPSNEENLPAAIALIHDAARTGVWIKDCSADLGNEPSAEWTPGGWSQAFWESPDIWTVPATLNQGATVDLNVGVRNNTGVVQNNVTVEVYYTDPRISLEFPNPNSILIGSRTVDVPSSGTTITMPWRVPVGTNSWGELHWCVGAVVKHDRDMPLSTLVYRSSNVACRNFVTVELSGSGFLLVAAQNFLNVTAELVVKVDEKTLPHGWKVSVPSLLEAKALNRRPSVSARKARLLDAKGIVLEPGEAQFIPVRVDIQENAAVEKEAVIRVHGALVPLIAGKRTPTGNGMTYRVVVGKKK